MNRIMENISEFFSILWGVRANMHTVFVLVWLRQFNGRFVPHIRCCPAENAAPRMNVRPRGSTGRRTPKHDRQQWAEDVDLAMARPDGPTSAPKIACFEPIVDVVLYVTFRSLFAGASQ